MNISIITGLISAGAAILVCLINNHYQREESEKKHEANIMLISYRLEQLEKKVDLHNNMIERTYELEKKTDLMEEQVKVANHRIDDLEKGDDRK
jgi:hypothetical protein